MTAVSVTHIGELPEVRRYHDDGKHNFMLHGGFGIRYIRESIADAALAAAGREVERLRDILSLRDSDLTHFEAEVERLKCCGNCEGSGHHGGAFGCFCDVDHLFINTEPGDPCHFDPSRWSERITP